MKEGASSGQLHESLLGPVQHNVNELETRELRGKEMTDVAKAERRRSVEGMSKRKHTETKPRTDPLSSMPTHANIFQHIHQT